MDSQVHRVITHDNNYTILFCDCILRKVSHIDLDIFVAIMGRPPPKRELTQIYGLMVERRYHPDIL